MENYTPRIDPARWTEIGPFVRDAVSIAAPVSSYSAHRLLVATTNFVVWCRNHGLPLDGRLLFQRATIEHYIRTSRGTTADGTLRNYRSMLLRVTEALFPEANPKAMSPLNDRGSVPPYTAADLVRLRNWADGQNTEARRRNARAMLCLCAGAGLRAIEVAELRSRDVVVDAEGILVVVSSPSGVREIPMLAEWEPLMRRVLRGLSAEDPIFGMPNRQTYKNLLSGFVVHTAGEDKPRSDRLRATWIVTHLSARTDMRALMKAASVSKFENLARYLQFIPELNSHEYRQHLRMVARR